MLYPIEYHITLIVWLSWVLERHFERHLTFDDRGMILVNDQGREAPSKIRRLMGKIVVDEQVGFDL